MQKQNYGSTQAVDRSNGNRAGGFHATTAEERSRRVDDLKKAVSDGTYYVDAEQIAIKIIEYWRTFSKHESSRMSAAIQDSASQSGAPIRSTETS